MSIERSTLLARATIEVSASDGPHPGTGFFVAPGIAFTSANLVGYLERTDDGLALQQSKQPIPIHWKNKRFYATIIAFLTQIDLAILRVDIAEQHQCVFIDSIARDYISYPNFYCFGYPPGDSAGQSCMPAVNGRKNNNGIDNLNLYVPGGTDLEVFTGAALLNERTGGVCAMVVGTRAIDQAGIILRTEFLLYLLQNFTRDEIQMICTFMGFSLDDLTASNQGRERVLLELLRYVDARGWLDELIHHANQARLNMPFKPSGAVMLASVSADIRSFGKTIEAAYREGSSQGLELAGILDRPELAYIIDAQRRYHAAHPEWIRSFTVEQRRAAGTCYPDDVGPPPECPYPGLRPFENTAITPFRGRDQDVDRLVHLIRNPALRLLVITGASGSGKSSLLRAGVLPELRRMTDLAVLDDGVLRLNDQPYTRLSTALDFSRDDPEHLTAAVDAFLEQRERQRLIVLIDQFEELLYPFVGRDSLTQQAEDERCQALNILRNLRRNHDIPITLVLVVRAEALAMLATVDLQASSDLTKYITPLAGDALRDSICFPAEAAGVDIERELVARLMLEATSQSSSPLPLIQVALESLWRTMRGNRLTDAAYQRHIGSLANAIQQHAAAIISELPVTQQILARNMIIRLVDLRDIGLHVRRPQLQERLLEVGTDQAAAQQTLTVLLQTKLLVSDIYRGAVWIELCHEALINNWSTLQDQWITALRQCEIERREWERLIDSWRNSDGRDLITNLSKIEKGTQWEHHCGLELGPIPDLALLLDASRQELEKQNRRRWTIFAFLFVFSATMIFVFYLFIMPILPP